jgi:hypothetical protein
MALDPNHPNYRDLQTRLEILKNRIAGKREEARQLFAIMIQELMQNPRAEIPKELQQQLEEIRFSLKFGAGGKEQHVEQEAQNNAVVTMDEMLKAMHSLTTSPDIKTKFSIKQLEEELKRVVTARHIIMQRSMPLHWQCHVAADDYLSLVNAKLPELSQKFGHSNVVMERTLELAEQMSNKAMDKLTKVSRSYISVPPPMAKSFLQMLEDSRKR